MKTSGNNMMNLPPGVDAEDQGTFNENLRRSFHRPLLHTRQGGQEIRRRHSRRKIGQVRLSSLSSFIL